MGKLHKIRRRIDRMSQQEKDWFFDVDTSWRQRVWADDGVARSPWKLGSKYLPYGLFYIYGKKHKSYVDSLKREYLSRLAHSD